MSVFLHWKELNNKIIAHACSSSLGFVLLENPVLDLEDLDPLHGGHGEHHAQGLVVKVPDGRCNGQPVEEAQVSSGDQNALKDNLEDPIEQPGPPEGEEGEERQEELDDVVAERLEGVPGEGGVVEVVGGGVGDGLGLVEVVHASQIQPASVTTNLNQQRCNKSFSSEF